MAAGGFSRIYAGLGNIKYQSFDIWRRFVLANIQYNNDLFFLTSKSHCLGPAAVGSAPNAALFFCTYDTIKKQAIAKWEKAQWCVLNSGCLFMETGYNPLHQVWCCWLCWTSYVCCQCRRGILFFFSQIVPSYPPGCCLPGPSSNRDCEAETTSRSCVSRPRCCQIHNQLRGPTHLLPHCFPILLSSVLQGVLGLYRGYFTTLAREIPFSLIQFPLWEFLKKQLATATGQVLEPSYLPPKFNL